MKIRVHIDEERVLNKVCGDEFGLLVSEEWKKLIDPFTPRDTGNLMGLCADSVDLLPFRIRYRADYAAAVYFSVGKRFRKINPFACAEWDVAAALAGRADLLTRNLNSALRRGNIFNL